MTLSYRHFLWVALFGFLFSFQAIASDDGDDGDDEVVIQMPQQWLQIHNTQLQDLYTEYGRAKWTRRLWDIGSDILKPVGYLGLATGTVFAFVATALEDTTWSLVSGIVGGASTGLLMLAKKADAGAKSKLAEITTILNRIEELEGIRRRLGLAPVEDDDGDGLNDV